jgi:hypothetical protein
MSRGGHFLRARLLPDFGVDAGSPVLDLLGRPSWILRKAPLKKSISRLRSANACFSRAFSSRNFRSVVSSGVST